MAFVDRIASAPISWGICEVPGWGQTLPTERVLTEMTDLGISATEYGAPGFLPTEPTAIRGVLDAHGMSLIGGFTPLVLHDPARRQGELARVREVAELFSRSGASTFVSCPVMDDDWWVPRSLGREEHSHLVRMLAEVDTICEDHGLHQVLRPHLQTVVETASDVGRMLHDCDVKWCLDTGAPRHRRHRPGRVCPPGRRPGRARTPQGRADGSSPTDARPLDLDHGGRPGRAVSPAWAGGISPSPMW